MELDEILEHSLGYAEDAGDTELCEAIHQYFEQQALQPLILECMTAFYREQTGEISPAFEDVQDYFEKLTNNPEDADMLVYAVFEDEYIKVRKEHGNS